MVGLFCRQGVVLTSAHLFDKPDLNAPSGQDARVRVAVHTDAGCQWHDAAILHVFTGALSSFIVTPAL